MSSNSLKIVAVGDMSFNGRYHRLLERRGADYPLRDVLPHWRDADLRLGNLESPLTTRPKVAPSKCTLRGAPRALDTLEYAGFDFVSVANNHVMDFGPGGLMDTRDKLDAAGIAYAGAGHNEQTACEPAILKRNGHVIGLLAYCDVQQDSPLYADKHSPGVARLQLSRTVRQIRKLRPRVDWLIVQLHWGQEFAQMPSPEQRALAGSLVDAGADLVLGHHPHVLQPMEIINGVPVFYSLGDFLFSDMFWRGRNEKDEDFLAKMRLHPLSRKTGWAEIVLERHLPPQVHFRPALLDRGLSVVPDDSAARCEEWEAGNTQLNSDQYPAACERDCQGAAARRDAVNEWRSLGSRLELRLFGIGLIQNAALGT